MWVHVSDRSSASTAVLGRQPTMPTGLEMEIHEPDAVGQPRNAKNFSKVL
jgi:hypothetical protein